MLKILFWARRKADLSPEEFRQYWVEVHAPLARDSLQGLRRYEVNIVTGATRGEPLVDGMAELYFDSRDAFRQAFAASGGRAVLDDLPKFTGENGTMFAEEHTII